MVRTALEALAAVKQESAHPTPPAEEGWCLKYVRQQYLIAAQWTTAALAWANAIGRSADAPPAGAPMFWTGGAAGSGHIAIADGTGWFYSTDILRSGRFDRVDPEFLHHEWPNLIYRGWATGFNSTAIPGLPPDGHEGSGGGDPIDPPKDDDMTPEQAAQLARVDAALAAAVGVGQHTFPDTIRAILSTAQGTFNLAAAADKAPLTTVRLDGQPEVYIVRPTGLQHLERDAYLGMLADDLIKPETVINQAQFDALAHPVIS